LAVCLSGRLPGQSSQEIRRDSIEKLELHHLKAEIVTYRGRAAVRIANHWSGRFQLRRRSGNGAGSIARGRDDRSDPIWRNRTGCAAGIARFRWDCVPSGGSFAFRVLLPATQEWTIGRSATEEPFDAIHFDSRISMGKLRRESPGKYESYVDLVPGQWTKLKIETRGKSAKLYVNRGEQPTLIVNDLKQPLSNGGIAVWVGQGTIAHFADVKVTP
jgi:hypothetical protein